MIDITVPLPTFQNIMYGWIGLAIFIFFLLLKITAPYGRHTTSKWGPIVSNKFGWLFMEAPVLIVLYAYLFPVFNSVSIVS